MRLNPPLQPGVRPLAVHSVDEFVLGVPDLEPARHFYSHFGLDVRDEDGALGLYTHGHPHRWARVVLGTDKKRLLWLSFGAYEQDLPALEHHFASVGVERTAPPEQAVRAGEQGGIWLRAPDGLAIRVHAADKSSPSAPNPRDWPGACDNAGRAPNRAVIQQVRPLHLSHILLFTADVEATLGFYTRVLGLRVSDKSNGIVAFMHTPHGSDHHLLALAKSDGGGLHHSSWCVPSIDAVGIGSDQMARAGYEKGWGVGRHVLGSNYFRYVRDPWGSYAEYSFDIDFVAAGADWPAAEHPPEDSFYAWGPAVPDDFIVNHETGAT